jgi:circadian clock protein KaiB
MKGRAAKRGPTGDGRRPAKLWRLRLHVTGRTPRPPTASANLKTTCETHREGRHRISLIDLLELPRLAKGGRILVIPRIARMLPTPVRTFIGDFSGARSPARRPGPALRRVTP